MNNESKIYEFDFIGGVNNIYIFGTNKDVVYEVKFKPSTYIFGEQPPFTEYAFEFVIEVSENPTGKNPMLDPLTSRTDSAIFQHFFQQKEKVVVYICDNVDGRGRIRNRKFDQWYLQYNKYLFAKYDLIIGSDDEKYFTSLIMRFDNPRLTQILDDFKKLSANYQK